MIKFLFLAFCFTSLALATPAEVSPSARESIECDIWIPQANQAGLPRVLLNGDSITRAHDPEVEQRLAGKSYVARLATSAFLSDPEARSSDERIAARNAIARQFVEAQHIPIDDLNTLIAGHPEYHSDNAHFNA